MSSSGDDTADLFQHAETTAVQVDDLHRNKPRKPGRLLQKLSRRTVGFNEHGVDAGANTARRDGVEALLTKSKFPRAKSSRTVSTSTMSCVSSEAECQPRQLIDYIIGRHSREFADTQSRVTKNRTIQSITSLDFMESRIEKSGMSGKKLGCIFEAAELRAPNLAHKPFGENWEQDVFTLFGNGIRQELAAAYEMLYSIRLNLSSVDISAIEDFCNWWKLFTKYVSDVQVVYEAVVFPWLESVIPLEGNLARDARIETRHDLDKLAEEVALAADVFFELDSSAFSQTADAVTKYTTCILEFLSRVEEGVPPCLQMFFNAESKRDADIKIREYVTSTRELEFFFPITLQWLSNTDPNHTEYLASILKGKLRFLYPNGLRRAEKYHFSLASRVSEIGFGTSSRSHNLGSHIKHKIGRHAGGPMSSAVPAASHGRKDSRLSSTSSTTSH